MSSTADRADNQRTAADRLGLLPGMAVQEIGHDDDVDDELLKSIEERTGAEVLTEDTDDVVDAVLLWHRDGDGDLVDALMDARGRLDANGVLWLMTPKAGRDSHVEPSDILDACPTVGLTQTGSIPVSRDWAAAKLVVPKGQRSPRHS